MATSLRRLAALTLAAVTAVACSGGNEPLSVPVPAADPPTEATPAPLEPPPTAPGGAPAPLPLTSTTVVAPPDTASTPGGGPQPAPLADPMGPPGAFAPVILRPDGSVRVVLELQIERGKDPQPGVIDHVAGVLGRETGKAVATTTVDLGEPTGRVWTPADVRRRADEAARARQGGGDAVLRLLLVGGRAENERALGMAVRGDVAAVFIDSIADAAPLVSGPAPLQRAVMTHEVGHLLGLVDLFLDTGRADPEHPHHSPNRGSVMFWGVESSLVGDVFDGPPPSDFDRDDRRDLARIRGGGG